MEASTEIAVTCEVEAPSAMARWKRVRSNCHLAACPRAAITGMMRKLLPKLSDGANDRGLGDFRPRACFSWDTVASPASKLLVNMDCELRNLPRSGQLRAATPVAIAAERIDVGQNPSGYHEIRLLAGLAQQIEPYRNSIILKANKQIFGMCDGLLFRGYFRPSSDGFNKRGCNGRRKLPLRQEKTKSSLFNPGTGIFQGESSKAVLAHSFGARLY